MTSMATLEKLVKAFEALKVFQSGVGAEEVIIKKKDQQPITKKEKMSYCNVIADCICAANLRHVADFPKFLGISIETFLMLCEDTESDVRMVADECLNRTIKTLLETNLGRLQVELYKEIKKNGSSRSLRAALWRFADMCHLIRPQKCRPYVVNLLPCVARICRRPEEAIQETLATAMQKICPVLMAFANDTEVKVLLKSFLPNLKSSSAAARRTAASSLTLVCQFTRKPLVFFSWLINLILDMVIPVQDGCHVHTLLGVMLSLRHVIPHLTNQEQTDESLKGSFGVVKREEEVKVSAEQLLQIFELLLHYTHHADHNVVTASLETLQQLLRRPPPALLPLLTTRGSISRTSIFPHDQKDLLRPRAPSHARLPSLSDDMSALEDDGDPGSEVSSQTTGSGSTEDLVPIIGELDPATDPLQSDGNAETARISDTVNGNVIEQEMTGEAIVIKTEEEEYTNMEIGDVNDEQMSRSSSADTISESRSLPQKQPTELRKGVSQEVLSHADKNGGSEIDVSEAIQPGSPSASMCQGDIGSITDQSEVPLTFCVRQLCSRFLLTGCPLGLVSDRVVRVSVKALALGCVGSALALYPRVFLYSLEKNSEGNGGQLLADILLYTSHSDPQLKGNTALLIGSFIKASMCESRAQFDSWLQKHSSHHHRENSLTVEQLISNLAAILDDESSVAVRLALMALNMCLQIVIGSVYSETGLRVLLRLLRLKNNPYWLVKVELLELLGEVDFQLVAYLESLNLSLSSGDHNYVGSLNIQERVLNDVILGLLGDEDLRVRHAAASSLIKLVPRLFHSVDSSQQDPIISKAKHLTEAYLEPIMHEWSEPPQPVVHGLVAPYHFTPPSSQPVYVEANLSRIVALLSHNLNKSSSKHMTHGCIHSLCLLSEHYLVSQYAHAWCCVPLHGRTHKDSTLTTKPPNKPPPTRQLSGGSVGSLGSLSNVFTSLSLDDIAHGSGGGALCMALSLLTASSVTLDLSAHQDVLQLSGNLFSGAAYKCLRSCEESSGKTPGTDEARWAALSDRLLVPLADTLFAHVARLLNICSHIVDEQSPGPPVTKPSLPSLPNAPSLSPIKRKAKGKEDSSKEGVAGTGVDNKQATKTAQKEKEKEPDKERNKKDGLGTFYNLPHYMRLYDILNSAYSNYKISLDLGSSSKFGSLLKVALQVLSQVMEVGLIQDIGKQADEILNYLKSTVAMEPTMSVLCVQQLLKALFGTNLSSQWESSHTTQLSRKPGKATRLTASMKPGLYHSCFITPYTQLTQSLASANFKSAMQLDTEDSTSLLGWLKKRTEKKVPAILRPGSKTDKVNSIANYIRLFEPLVIKALKQYTITSSLHLQRQVLNLLAQLVQLRVNYCLLDSDQIFIGFVIKQFEYIEEGQIRNSETLIPHIFHFLVLLSYERYHSKSIISMPKIIQLCDGIMASGQQPTTHAIPALQPILHDLFVLRSINKMDGGKDLETQREVVVSMLLRLIQYYQVLEMFIVVLHQCHKESEEKWKRLSRQVVDLVVPLLIQQQLNMDSQMALDVVHRLFESVAPSVFRPVDTLLKALFTTPANLSCAGGLEQWLCLVLSVLRVLISQSKEEVVLSRLQELALTINIFTDTVAMHSQNQAPQLASDNLSRNKTLESPEETFARFLLQVVGLVSSEISWRTADVTVPQDSYTFLCQQLSHLLLYITHMFQSGLFRRVATSTMALIRQAVSAGFYSVDVISESFRDIAPAQPLLTLQWCNILTLLNYDKQEWWSAVMHTPPRYTLNSPNRHNFSVSDALMPASRCCHLEVVRRGSMVLFCDYVCENLNDAEQMTWVIINHVSDLIQLSHEPPVQDFISAIHRNSAASGLFIQAIHSRCENMTKTMTWFQGDKHRGIAEVFVTLKPSHSMPTMTDNEPLMVKKTLLCLEAIHLTQSGALLTLLIDKFLHTHHLSVARMCDSIACRRLEMLLAENLQDSSSQLPLEDLEKLLQFMKTTGLIKRHARLVSLLNKLRNLMCPESILTVSPDKTHPLAITASDINDITVNKDWYLSISRDACFSPAPSCRECAAMLSQLDYSDVLNIIMTKEFNLSILEECIALGAQRTMALLRRHRDYGTNMQDSGLSDSSGGETERTLDPLLQAAQLTLFRLINNVINTLPVPHRIMSYSNTTMAGHEEQYHDKMEDLFTDSGWFDTVFHLASALLQYLVSLSMFPWEGNVPEESTKDVGRFIVLCAEIIEWIYHQGQLSSSDQLQVVLECTSLSLQNVRLSSLIGRKEHASWVCSLTSSIHQILSSLLVLPGEKLVTLPNQESQEELPKAGFDEMHHCILACDQISELVHCLKTHLNPENVTSEIPSFLAAPLRNVILGLARLPLLNSYARVPPIVWKMGWMPTPTGESKTKLPPLPLEYLQEKDVLKEFIFRVNTLGWTSRQQFEETWMGLLGVLNPVAIDDHQVSTEEEIERTQGAVLAIRGITSLLIQTTLSPHPGNPNNSLFEHRPRDKPLAFLYTRCGRKLSHIRGIVEKEIMAVVSQRPDQMTHYAYCTGQDSLDDQLFHSNNERELGLWGYYMGQMSIESMWSTLGMLDMNLMMQTSESSSESSTGTESPESPRRAPYPALGQITFPLEAKARLTTVSGLDIHSCLQFLLDQYGQWLSPTVSPRTPLMQYNETIKSVVILSDIFTEKQQFDWMLETLLEVSKTHPSEDVLVHQYVVLGMAKAAAIVGLDQVMAEKVLKLLESSLRSTHLPTKVAALYGCLYQLEAGITEISKAIVPMVTDYIIRHLSAIMPSTISSQQHVMVMWSTAFYVIENFSEEIRETDFTVKIVQLAVTTASGHEDVTPLSVYLMILRGLERLLLASALTQHDSETLTKLSVERLTLSSSLRALAALGLLFTCMYSGKEGDQWSPTRLLNNQVMTFPTSAQDAQTPTDPEILIVAMERVTVLFDRIRKGYPFEARIISRVLPTFLADFFPPQDVMNKVIAEFLSSQQPHPQLLGNVVFQVFENLLDHRQHGLVQDWVLLSLSNFTQRTPVSMAIWSLTCFFISASTNPWLRSLLSHVVGRMGKTEAVDRKLFCISAHDFYSQLKDENLKRTFLATFQTVANNDPAYNDLIACCPL